MKELEFSIVLPAYNESENLPTVIGNLRGALKRIGVEFEIIVVDNGSTDNTVEVLESLKKKINQLRILRIKKNIGFGNGILKGLAIARSPILGFMDADNQVRAEDLSAIFLKLKNERLDFCKGTRINRSFSWPRKAISKIYNFLFKLMFFSSFKDINGNPKVFTRGFYQEIRPVSKDWFLDAEIMLKARRGKYKMGEVPIVYLERGGGASSVSILTILEFIKNMIYWRFLLWKR